MAQRRMSKKSFRKSRGRRMRSMRKRTMGGENDGETGGEVVENLYNKLAEVSTPTPKQTLDSESDKGPQYDENDRLAIIEDLDGNQSENKIGLLSNNKSCRPNIFASRDKNCEEMKAKYYFAAKELLRFGIHRNIFYGEYDNKGSTKDGYMGSLERKARDHVFGDNLEKLHNEGREIAAITLDGKGKTEAAKNLRNDITQPQSSGGKSRRRRNKKSRKTRRR